VKNADLHPVAVDSFDVNPVDAPRDAQPTAKKNSLVHPRPSWSGPRAVHVASRKASVQGQAIASALAPLAFVAFAVCAAYLAPAAWGQMAAAHAASDKAARIASFRAMAVEASALVDKAQWDAARKHVADLDAKWDALQADASQYPAQVWATVDASVHQAMQVLAKPAPDAKECKQALRAVIAEFDKLRKQG